MHCDGIPQKLLNYMAAGKGIVCSAGSAKLLEHERTGLIVPNGDVDAFAAAIVRLAADPRVLRMRWEARRATTWSVTTVGIRRPSDSSGCMRESCHAVRWRAARRSRLRP